MHQDRVRGLCGPIPTGNGLKTSYGVAALASNLERQQQSSDWGAERFQTRRWPTCRLERAISAIIKARLDVMLRGKARRWPPPVFSFFRRAHGLISRLAETRYFLLIV